MRSTDVRGRVVAITGAARGIGLATAGLLAARGARVALGDLDAEGARAAAARLAEPADAIGLPLDVCDTASFAAFLDDAAAALGPIDVLVNNAGIMWVGPFDAEPEGTAERQMAVNFHGVARGIRLAAERMRRPGGPGAGHVVTIASAASRLAPAGEASYAATKHAVLGYVTAVREELRASGVELSLVMPVVVDTDLARGTGTGRGPRLEAGDVAAAVLATIEHPRPEVHVPSYVGAVAPALGLMPTRVRDVARRFLVPDQVRQADRDARAGYEAAAGVDGRTG